MKAITLLACLFVASTASASEPAAAANHRYIVERTFPKGALDGLDTTAKAKVNQTNEKFGVRWEMSYANAEKTKTFCVYDGPNEDAVRKAAAANKIPVDSITEVPVTLDSK